jgi:hypothetical protein
MSSVPTAVAVVPVPVAIGIIGKRIVIGGVPIAEGTVVPIVAFIIAPIRRAGSQGDNET